MYRQPPSVVCQAVQLTPDILETLKRVVVVISLVWQDEVKVVGDRGALVRALESVPTVEGSRHLVSPDVLVRCRAGSLADS